MKLLLGLLSFLTAGSLLLIVISVLDWVFGGQGFNEMLSSIIFLVAIFVVSALIGNWLWRRLGSPDP